MSEEKNIKNYTAADIEKYWNGKLSTAEMHAIEKAAMDDPFLADALEGYKNTNNVTEDIVELHSRLDKRVIAPVIPLKEKKVPWLKVAAAVIVISGVGLLVQQLVLNKKESSIVNVDNPEKDKADVATIEQPKPDTSKITTGGLSDTLSMQAAGKKQDDIKKTTAPVAFSAIDTAKAADGIIAGDIKTESIRNDVDVKSAPSIVTAQKNESAREKESSGRSALDSTKTLNLAKPTAAASRKEAETLYDASTNANNGVANFLSNKYNYRVIDAQNNPVPFANVMNTRDNVGTYTDIKGNFNLLSSDSVLNVQIRSLGYLSDNYKLVPNSPYPTIVLKEDNNSRRQFQAPTQSVVSNVTRKDTAELEEPEVGWGYYNTYVANNIQIPDNIRKKSGLGSVELSFDIDKTGHPVNIKVTKSSQCKECDDEAVRLLKEGPKWKRKGKKSKTTISIAVDQK